ncbi:MAG: hypothetical protein JRI68_06965 [Deltaproteobacteria bacterium]|nr:hypothetical protein [Deltaproteobacteria bacterium]
MTRPSQPRRRDVLLAASLAGAACFVPSIARAAGTDDKGRLKAKRYRLPMPGSDIGIGGATLGIYAPMAAVLKVVLKYGNYDKILPRLEQSRIVGKEGDETDVYVRAPILRGVAHIWGVIRFGPPEPWAGEGKTLTGRLVKGNVEAYHGRWKLYPCGEDRTILQCEQFIDLKIPVPSSLVTPELEWAADKGVTAVRDIAECEESTVPGA